MKTRRITLGLSAVGGGLLAAAFLPLAVANADTTDALGPAPITDVFGFEADHGPESVLTVSGLPPLYQQVEGYQTFGYVTPSGDDETIHADVSTLTTPGFENTEYLVAGVAPDDTKAQDLVGYPTEGYPTEGLPTDGSVYDIANFGNGFENVYSDVLPEQAQRFTTDATTDALSGTGTAATGTITDTFVTPFGNIDLTPLVDGFSTAVNPFDDFLTTVDPSLVLNDGVGSILGSFGDVLQMY
jgi:hypothetical protein